MALEMQARLDECARVHDIRCVYITGMGKAFSAGQDPENWTGDEPMGDRPYPFGTLQPDCKGSGICPNRLWLPWMAPQALAPISPFSCDVVLAVESAFHPGLQQDRTDTRQRRNLVPAQADRLAESVRTDDAGRKSFRHRSGKMGMISGVWRWIFADESFTGKNAFRDAHQRLAYTKHALNYSFINSIEEQLQPEDKYQQKSAATADYKEGVNAFLEKGNPHSTETKQAIQSLSAWKRTRAVVAHMMEHDLFQPVAGHWGARHSGRVQPNPDDRQKRNDQRFWYRAREALPSLADSAFAFAWVNNRNGY